MRNLRAPARSAADRFRLIRIDPLMVAAVLILAGLGILNLSALGQQDLAVHQGIAVGLGLFLMALAARTRGRDWPWLGRTLLLLAIALLALLSVAGETLHGTRRWIGAGPLALQPSELAKLGLLLVLATRLGRGAGPRRSLLAIGIATAPIALTLLEPDLSTSVLLVTLLLALLLLARSPVRVWALMAGGAAAVAPVAERLLHPYQLQRLHAFLHGASDLQGGGWTVLQAHIAIASGGFGGVDGSLPSRLLSQYLPARETDLAFASLVEQRGLLAGGAALLATAVLVWRLAITAARSREPTAGLVAGGLAVLIGVEVSISVAGNMGLLPIAGVPCPLLSYGGTAAVAHLTAIGLVLGARSEECMPRLSLAPRHLRRPPRLGRVLSFCLCVALASLGWSGFRLQLTEGATLRGFAHAEMTRTVVLLPPRGLIEDRHGVPLAVDAPDDTILVVPAILTRSDPDIDRLAAALAMPRRVLEPQLAAPPTTTAVALAGDVSEAMGRQVAAARIPGVVVVPSQRRLYPAGPLVAPLLGFVGVATPDEEQRLGPLPPGSVVGRSGLELEYDSVLRGKPGGQGLLVSPTGVPVALSHADQPARGGDLRLSVDLGLQRAATDALATALRGVPGQPRGEQGAAVVLQPRTGEVLAMASLPAYDDNLYGPPLDLRSLQRAAAAPGNTTLEHATALAAPPGSTFKLVVGAADAVSGAIPASKVIPTGGSFQLGKSVFKNWSVLPPQNLPHAIAWSNDVYFYKVALALGSQRIHAMGDALGAGTRSGIDLPGEVAGFLGTPETVGSIGESWYSGSTVLLGIGQGFVTASPLQVARWTGGVATGVVVTPHLGLQARTGGAGQYVPVGGPPARALGFASQLGPVREGLRLAVAEGTGTLLKTLPFIAGGKTGTAEDPSTPGGAPDAWYTAVAPLDNPDVVVTVFVRGGGEGYWTSEPAARSILQYYGAHAAEIHAQAPLVPPPPPPRARSSVAAPAPPAAPPGPPPPARLAPRRP